MDIFCIFDIFTEILFQLNPQSVINLCQITSQITKIYSNDSLFQRLILCHYPNSAITKFSKKQYIALTSDVKNKYCLIMLDTYLKKSITDTYNNTMCLPHIFINEVYRHDEDDMDCDMNLNFIIDGIQPDDGDTIWLQINTNPYGICVKAFLNKVRAIDDFLTHHYDNIINHTVDLFFERNSKYDQLCKDYYSKVANSREIILNLPEFKLLLPQIYYPNDLSKNALFDYIMINLIFNYRPVDWELWVCQFIKVTINNKLCTYS